MAEIATNFPPQTYSSSFFLNSLTDEDKNAVNKESGSGKRTDAPLLDCFITTFYGDRCVIEILRWLCFQSSKRDMMLQFLVLILFLSKFTSEVFACELPNEEKIRTFNSIVEYQANKNTFNSAQPGWLGSIVRFNISSIKKLEKNVFVTDDSEDILKLILTGKQIEKIEDGAFLQLNCLDELLLGHNNITKLSKNTFQGLDFLENLDLSDNKLSYLSDLVFSSLHRLKILNLSKNQIGSVQSFTFTNLTALEVLNLEGNRLGGLPVDVFLPLTSLRVLNLAWNNLAGIEPEKWQGLQKLENLNFAGNDLDHFDPSYNFTFSSLKNLNLSYNGLTMLNVVAMHRHLPKLGLVDLNNNFWFCDELESIVQDLNNLGIKFVENNRSENSVQGIACSEMPVVKSTTAKSVSSTTQKYQLLNILNKTAIERIVEKKFKESSENINDAIQHLQTLVIFLFVLLSVFIFFEIFVRTNCCRNVLKCFKGDRETYFDSSNIENYRLLNR